MFGVRPPPFATTTAVRKRLRRLCLIPLASLALFSPAADAAVVWAASGGVATGAATLSVPYPAGVAAGNLLVLVVGDKYGPGYWPNTPAGWTRLALQSGGIDTNTGVDRGQVISSVFVKEAVGGETGNLAMTFIAGTNTAMARMFRYTKTAGSAWETATSAGTDDTPGSTWSVTAAANPGITAGDVVLVSSALNGNQVTNWSESLNTAGITYAAVVERNDSTSGTGDDMGLIVAEFTATAGTATAAPIYTMTGAGGSATTYSPTGATVFLRLRQSSTTLATGSDPAAATIAPGTAATDVNTFTLQTSSATEAITAVTVNLSTNAGIARLAITDNGNNELGFTTSPVTGSNTINVSGMSAGTTLATFKVRVTPFSHAAMPAIPGGSYAITAPVTAWTGPNTHLGSDTNANVLTIDNASPASATAISGSAGQLKNTLNWTASASEAVSSVIYRWSAAVAGGEFPAEGSSPTLGAGNGGATVACVISSSASAPLTAADGQGGSGGCLTAALTSGQNYTYKLFQRDASGNFDAGVPIGTFKPFGVVSAGDSTIVAQPSSVAADNFTSATLTVTLKDNVGTPVPGKPVTLAADTGNSVITTLNGTSSASGVATFSVVDGTVEGPITYSATATETSSTVTLTQKAQVTFTTPSLCYSDNFNRSDGTLLSTGYWTRTRGTTTGYDADIVSGRLRMTDAVGNRATAVHLFRLFPGDGNKVTAEFDYYSYGGTGADGLAFTLSDSSIAPVAGAFGGSLGYAPKNATACPPSGCPGFTGGWIGVGLDEFGNYSNPTEGRVDGPGFRPNSVAIRGSGSAYAGYNWHTGATTSSITTTATTAHRYRVIVDHSDGEHAYVSVERDTSGGTNYSSVIAAYDAKAIATQGAVPAYWYFSFSASTGASTDIHEVDNLNICTAQPMVTPTLNHVRLIHDGTALTCGPETITLRACANASCSALYTGSVTLTLPTISGATWSASSPITFSGGQTSLTLTKTSAGSVNLAGATVTSPTILNSAAVCYNGGVSGNCTLTYSADACVFDAVESGAAAATPIYTKLAGVPFNLDVRNQSGLAQTVSKVEIVDASSGNCSGFASMSSTTGTWAFTATGSGQVRTFSLTYANALPNARIRITSTAGTSCSTDNFTIRPISFNVSTPAAGSGGSAANTGSSGTPALKAGSATFTLSASSGATGYTGTALVNKARIGAHTGAVQPGTLGGAFSPAILGISSGTGFTYSEVGSFQFLPWGVYDDGSFASVDRSKATPECVSDAKLGTAVTPADPNAIDANGMYGCYFGGTNGSGGTIASPFFGRFTPDHFVVAPVSTSAACTAATPFSYFGQDGFATVFSITAQNADNQTTVNYEGNGSSGWARLPLTAWGSAPASAGAPGFGFAASAWAPAPPSGTPAATLAASATAPTATNSNTWKSGTATVTARHKVVRPADVPALPSTVTLSALPVDADGITTAAATTIGNMLLRYGRLSVDNAFGSERQNLPVRLSAWYYAGAPAGWAINADDACTASAILTPYNATGTTADCYGSCTGATAGGAGSVLLQRPAGNTGNALAVAAAPTPVGAVTLAAGQGSIVLRAPLVAGSYLPGALTLTFVAPAWLKTKSASGYDADPVGQITFGVYGPTTNKTKFIYLRENY